jgi:GNAT superfamily N-acetyltransferase
MAADYQIRTLIRADISVFSEMDHNYDTDYVWQMDLETRSDHVNVEFRATRLPRTMHVIYPLPTRRSVEEWQKYLTVFTAVEGETPVGYIGLKKGETPNLVLVNDLVVDTRYRRQGVGTKLLLAAQAWSSKQDFNRMLLQMQSKNFPAICFSQKLGFEFCGYCDQCFANQDIALMFYRKI